MDNDQGALYRAFEEGYQAGYREGQAVGFRDGVQAVHSGLVRPGPPVGYPPHPAYAGLPGTPGSAGPPPLNPEEAANRQQQLVAAQAERRRRSANRNLNALLYAASFLLIGAAAALLAGSLPNLAKLFGVWGLAVLFLGCGLLVHALLERLRPAGTAFTATGLALIPFGGVAIAAYTPLSPSVAWLITSLVALLAFVLVLWRVPHRAMGYLTVAAVFSIAVATTTSLALPIRWSLLAVIVVATAATVIAWARRNQTRHLVDPPTDLASWLASPLACLAALGSATEDADLVLVGVAGTLQYAIAYVLEQHWGRLVGVRLLAQLAVIAAIMRWIPNGTGHGALLIASGAVQLLAAAAILFNRRRTPAAPRVAEYLLIAVGVMVMATAGLVGPDLVSLIAVLTITGSAALTAWLLRNPALATVAGVTSGFVPAIASHWAASSLTWWPTPIIHLALAWIGIGLVLALTRGFRSPTKRPDPWWIALAVGVPGLHLLLAIVWPTIDAPAVADVLVPTLAIPGVLLLATGLDRRWAQPLTAIPFLAASVRLGTQVGLPDPWPVALASTLTMLLLVAWVTWDSRLRDGSPPPLRPLVGIVLATVAAIPAVAVVVDDGLVGPRVVSHLALLIAVGWLAGLWRWAPVRSVRPAAGMAMAFLWVAVLGSTVSFDDVGRLPAYAVLAAIAWLAATLDEPPVGVLGVIGAVAAVAFAGLGLEAPWSVLWAHLAAGAGAVTLPARRDRTDWRLAGVLAVLTLTVGIVALGEGGIFPLVFLTEQVAILILGALLSRSWAIWWGLAATTLGLMYFLLDYLFIQLVVLAVVLIGVVIWRLLRTGRSPRTPH